MRNEKSKQKLREYVKFINLITKSYNNIFLLNNTHKNTKNIKINF